MDKTNIRDFGISIANPNNKETFSRYLSEVAKYSPLTKNEEIDLFKRIKATGDERAIDKLCKHNLRFVISIAKRYASLLGNQSKITLEDLISEGNLGMVVAIERYDNSSGNRFLSYAVWWIKQRILAHISDHSKNIRMPTNIIGKLKKFRLIEAEMEQRLGGSVSTTELFEELKSVEAFSEEKTPFYLDELFKMGGNERSLSAKVSDDSESDFSDFLKDDNDTPDNALINKERYELLHKMLETVPRHIVEYFNDYFGLDGREVLSIKKIAEKHEYSEGTIKRNIEKYLRKLRINNKVVRKYFFPTPDYSFIIRRQDQKVIDEKKTYVSPIMFDYEPKNVGIRGTKRKKGDDKLVG